MEQISSINEVLYDKTYTCPLCGQSFKSKAIRSGKNKLLTVDEDLYAHYELIDPLLCDIVVCPHCSYSVLAKTLAPLLPKQKEWLKETFNQTLPSPTHDSTPTINDAIHKHKLALLACIVRKSKLGEQAYLSLHLSWLYRSAQDTPNELTFLNRAYNGFSEAYTKETFPMVGMDEGTVLYLLAILAYKLELKNESKQHLAKLLTLPNSSARIKERGHMLKQKLHSS